MANRLMATMVVVGVSALATQIARAADVESVTVDNFIRAESDLYFSNILKESGGTGKFSHRREPAAIDQQTVIRLNRDTLYSAAVFDLDAGPVTVMLPDAGDRFMSMLAINEDHYVTAVAYGAGSHTFARDQVGTRYLVLAIRTFVNPADAKDVEQAHALQDAITVEQASQGTFEVPNWDEASQKKVRDALLILSSTTQFQQGVRRQGRGRSNPTSAGKRRGMGRQSRQGRHLSKRHTGPQRRHDCIQAQGWGCAGGWILVGEPLQRGRLLREESLRFLFDQQRYCREEQRRLDRYSVWRLRRQDRQLLADHEGLELHSSPLPSARRDPGQQLDVPRTAAGAINL